MQNMVEQYQQEHDIPALEIAAALAKISMGDRDLLMAPDKHKPARAMSELLQKEGKGERRRSKSQSKSDKDKERFRIEVGHDHGVKPGNIVGAIANEAGLDGQHIGSIEIKDNYSLVDLPAGMPNDVFNDLKKVRVCGQPMHITRLGSAEAPGTSAFRTSPKKKYERGLPGRKSSGGKFEGKKSGGGKFEGKKTSGAKFEGKKTGGAKSEGKKTIGTKFEGKKTSRARLDGKKKSGPKILFRTDSKAAGKTRSTGTGGPGKRSEQKR